MLAEFTDTAIEFTQTEATGRRRRAADESDAPVVKLVNLIIQEAVSLRACDIHIEPFADRVRVRYRIDGVLVERDSPPRRLLGADALPHQDHGVIDIAEKRRPQDGRIKMTVQGKHFDLRVSMLPTVHGQSAVMRILDRGNIQVTSGTWASARKTTTASSRSSSGPTASSSSPARPGPARRPPSTPRSTN